MKSLAPDSASGSWNTVSIKTAQPFQHNLWRLVHFASGRVATLFRSLCPTRQLPVDLCAKVIPLCDLRSMSAYRYAIGPTYSALGINHYLAPPHFSCATVQMWKHFNVSYANGPHYSSVENSSGLAVSHSDINMLYDMSIASKGQ